MHIARMPGNPYTSVRSRQVAAALRELREQAGLSGAEVAKRMGMSPSKISRIETGNSGLKIEDVAALLGFYQVPASTRDELLDLVRRSEERAWLVYLENHGTYLFLEEETDLAAYRSALGNILNSALGPAATTELIAQIVTELG